MSASAEITDETASVASETLVMLERVAAFVGVSIFAPGVHELTVLLVSDAEIAALHDSWFQDPTPTDVITFPAYAAGDLPGVHDPHLGDIVLSVDTARAAAAEVGWPLARELAFVLVHGMLHLAGWDDETDDLRAAMLAEGERLLQQFEQASGVIWH